MKIAARLLAAMLTVAGCDEADSDPLHAPRDADELHAWLVAGEYRDWESESDVFPSQAGGGARVYLSPDLTDSLAGGLRAHPVGAGAVREIYDAAPGALIGWAAAVKVEPDGGQPAWLWLELLDVSPGAMPSVAQVDAPGCLGCHGDGVDSVQTTVPLR